MAGKEHRETSVFRTSEYFCISALKFYNANVCERLPALVNVKYKQSGQEIYNINSA